MRLLTGWMVAGLAALALGPATARVEPARPAPEAPKEKQPQLAQYRPPVVQPAPQPQVYVRPASTGFEGYKNYLAQLARSQRVREATIQSVVPSLRLNERAMQLDRAQRPTSSSGSSAPPPLSPYLQQHVTSSLISRGQSRYSAHWPHLARLHAVYGVDPAVVMAIYGKETSYGSVTGSFDLLEVLASLAYEGRRRQLFESEFISALKLIDRGVPRWRLKGSYAGATGYPQFMPSVALRLRADGDGDGYADIWNSEADAFASIANYLRDAGWKAGVPWGAAVRVPPTLNRAAIRSTMVADRCPAVFRRHSRWLKVGEWRTLGVTPYRQPLPDSEMATLMEPDGPGGTAYLLTNNYRAILEYNCSNFYAMSVALLADRIARR